MKQIYLDSASTAKINKQDLEFYTHLLELYYGNYNSVHQAGIASLSQFNKAKEQIATLLNILPEEIIFTSGATEANSMALKGLKHYSKRHIVTSKYEHPSISETIAQMVKYDNYTCTYLEVDKEGQFLEDTIYNALNKDTVVVSLFLVQPEIGLINDIKKIKSIIDNYNHLNHTNIFLHVDATQGIGKVPFNFYDADLVSISQHKLGGIKGSGLLFCRKDINLLPLISGESRENKNRSGTIDVASIVLFAKVLERTLTDQKTHQNIVKLGKYLRQKLTFFPLNTPLNTVYDITSFSTLLPSEVVVNYLSNNNVFVSAGSACSSKRNKPSLLIEKLYGVKRAQGAIRISLGSDNTIEDIDRLITLLLEVKTKWG